MIEKISIRPGKSGYCIPKIWLLKDYGGEVKIESGKAFVEPSQYFHSVIQWILEKKESGVDYTKSVSLQKGITDRSWIKSAIVYSCLPRCTAAYNHKGFGRFEVDDIFGYRESGTFLKMIALLPHFYRLGVNTLYLLPITESSNLFRKGEIGSPYSVKDFLKIDPLYHDPLLDGWNVEDEFLAFVEACHILGIRVLMDFIPRTAARDCNLILNHPEWFYWIKVDELVNYLPPVIPELGFCQPTKEIMQKLYDRPEIRNHLKKFCFDPKTTDPEKWDKLRREITDQSLIPAIIRHFGMMTAPGFSDWINDPQPTWDDVTFLRLYMDHPFTASGKVGSDHPPYVLFDVIKSSNFPGKVPNLELWNYIASIIPHFQKKYGIDGIRLDMGHALPDQLQQLIIKNARDHDPSFVFIAEELEMHRSKEARESGYDAIIGNSWWMLPRIPDKAYEFIQSESLRVELPYIAAAETPDTPRIFSRDNGKYRFLIPFLCCFAPNGIFMINSGQEIEETQPMNLGLDNNACGRFTLACGDEFQGKLAFFDHYVLHWKDSEIVGFLSELSKLRNMFSDLILHGVYRPVYLSWQDGKTANISYWNEHNGVIVIANLDANERTMEIDLEKTCNVSSATKIRSWRYGEWFEENADKIIRCSLKGYDFALYEVSYNLVVKT
ncbi:alpha-amylase family protein [Pseudothermotoga elfii]|uniref:maltodextrin glycosyltransferase n=1 Tax=Pseudothermotoga elfii TaxID=38322 RepID=UPI000418EB39|nr:maltodextrin glycosyltransferase [Pseudothermotoga elfii]